MPPMPADDTYKMLYVNEVMKAAVQDNMPVESFIDGFEWDLAYRVKYGAYAIDFDVSTDRTVTEYGLIFAGIIANNGFPSPTKSLESNKFEPLPPSAIPSEAS